MNLMGKIKNALCIIFTIICIIVLYLNGVFFTPWVDGRKLYIKDFVNVTPLVLILLPIVFLIRYIYMLRKKNKYFDIKKLNNIIILFSFSIFAIGLVDVLRYYFFSSKILDVYLPTFMFQYIVLIEIIYLILFFWIIFLNKTKIKRSLLDKFKIANNVITIILINLYGGMGIDHGVETFMFNCLFLILLQIFFLLRKNKQSILLNIYNILLVFCNITLLVFIILNIDFGFAMQLILGLLPLVASLTIICNDKRKILKIAMCLIAIGVYIFSITEPIKVYIIQPLEEKKEKAQMVINLKKGNEYSKKINYDKLKNYYSLTVNNKQEIYNLIYTFFDSGVEKVTIKCSKGYKECETELYEIIDGFDQIILSHFASPYNRANNIYISNNCFGDVVLNKTKYYLKSQIKDINNKVNKIYEQYYDNNKSVEENIKIFHDYIITNIEHTNDEKVNNAYSLFFEGKSSAYGYSEAMELFLDKMGIKNIKIAAILKNLDGYYSMWNLVFVDGEWKHLDVFADDVVTSSCDCCISSKYFLIDTKTFESYNPNTYDFNKEIYEEFLN